MGGKLRLGLHCHPAWHFDRSARSNRQNAAAVYEDGAVFEWVVQLGTDKSLHQPRPGRRRHDTGQWQECQEQNNRERQSELDLE
jgi:hypothetical protein